MDPAERAILQLLLRRCECEIAPLGPGARMRAQDDPRYAGGGHFATAVRLAREALATDDPEKVTFALRWAPGYERTGRELAEKAKRRRGGAVTAVARRGEASEQWKPWVSMHEDLKTKHIASGLSKHTATLKARRDTAAAMTKAQQWPTGNVPSEETLRKWLK
jgi:hypothetical protein